MKTIIKLLFFMLTVVLLSQCEKDEVGPNENWVIGADWIDTRDGNTYATIPIGDQVWMAENMAYLPSVYSVEDGSEDEGYESDPFYYVYGYDGTEVSAAKATSNYQRYGVLYNWNAAREACPEGWHLPSDEEWIELEIYLGMTPAEASEIGFRGTDEGLRLKSTWGWDYRKWKDYFGNGTNESGFTGRPGGGRFINYLIYNDPFTYYFSDLGGYGYWWSNSEADIVKDETYVYYRALFYFSDEVYKLSTLKHEALSVRCIKD